MKKFAKIFVAVAGLFVGFACTTDVTEDLGVQVGNGVGQTTVTLSLEESRTSLGAEVNNLYPVTWSSDDAISINGVKSASIAIADGNPAVATFSFNETLKTPYCVAYPAAAEGKVIFAEQQVYTDGTFADGAAAMYGYSESTGSLSLQHLTGVLKIGVVGDKTLSYAQISTADRAPIAGEFELDFATGEVTPTKNAKEVISYSFPEDLVLATTPQYIHVAVPAGVYDELYVTLYDTEGGVMYATVKADSAKPLSAGKVRKFVNDITYAPNASVFVIKDKTSLLDFAAQAATLNKDALFIADVDMTGEAWTPIEGYNNIVLGNGYAIKGLTAPLFGTTSASIKGLHLIDAVLSTNNNPIFGGFACKITATNDLSPVIEHCSISGTFTVKNDTYSQTTKNDKNVLLYGPIAGYAVGATIKDCVNNATINVEQSGALSSTTSQIPTLGGIVGRVDAYTNTADTTLKTFGFIKNCTNNGAITVDEKCWESGKGLISYYLGGIVAFVANNNAITGEIYGCTNNAPIKLVNLNNYGDGDYAMIGGIVGYTQISNKNMHKVTNCVNTKKGKITVAGTGTSCYVGGIGGYVYNCEWTNITNYADIDCPAILSAHFYIAGCLSSPGLNDSDGNHIHKGENITNYGAVNVTGAGGVFYVGGLFARSSQGDVTKANNYGAVTVKPTQVSTITNVIIGGLEAVGVGDGDAGTLTDCHNYAPVYIEINGAETIKEFKAAGFSAYSHRNWDNCTNEKEGTLTVKGSMKLITNNDVEDTNTDSQYTIGSMCGYRASNPNANSTNYADVIVDVDWSSDATVLPFIQIGGYFGRTHQNIPDTCRSYGDLYVKGSTTNCAGSLTVGGLAGSRIYTGTNWVNDCDVFLSGTHNKAYIGGCAGYCHGYKGSTMTGAVNNGKVYVGVDKDGKGVETSFIAAPNVGGIFGHTFNAMTDCTNEGEVYYKANRPTGATGSTEVGGVLGYSQNGSAATSLTLNNVVNNGKVTIEGDNGTLELWAGGINGYMYGTGTQTKMVNNGELIVNMDSNCTGHFKIGGISGGIRNAISNSENNGKITIKGTVGKTLYLGGIIANANGYHRTNLSNNGDILIDGKIKYDCFIGGICYDAANGNPIKYTNCHNTGDITVTKDTYIGNAFAIGGIIAKYTAPNEKKIFVGCSNSGNISSAATSEGRTCLAGLMGYTSGTIVVVQDGFVNTGNITHSGLAKGADDIYVAGAFGYISGTVLSYETTSGETTTTTTWSGNIVNKGKLSAAGKSQGGQIHVGGITGFCNQPLTNVAKYINLGDLSFTGDPGSKNGVKGTTVVGGIVGELVDTTIDNAEVHCNIHAVGAEYVGMVTGMARTDKTIVSNSAIGGTLCKEQRIPEDDDIFDKTPVDYVVTIDEYNFMDYIYGSVDWAGSTTYDGCSFLSVKPAI